MLPIFPNALKATRQSFMQLVLESMKQEAPLLNEMRTTHQFEGRDATYERSDGKNVDIQYEKISSQIERPLKNGEGFSGEEFFNEASRMGSEMAHQLMENFHRAIDQAVTEVGNVIDCKHQGFSFEHFLELLSVPDLEFDSSGNPHTRVLLASPGMLEQFTCKMREWALDREKNDKVNEVMRKKREEFNEREANRRMVD